MLFLADASESHDVIASELKCEVGQLITPLTRRKNRGGVFGIDNGAFAHFDAKSFRSLLKRETPNKDRCLFVAAPDVVCSARRTLECFEQHWRAELEGWPLALVMQDGQENLPIPWALISCIFVGGSDEFKLGPYATHCIKAAQIMGKYVHVGRINTPNRWEYFEKLGVDSCDGTGLSRYTHMRNRVADLNLFDLAEQPPDELVFESSETENVD